MKHINEITSDKIKLFDNLVELPNNLLAASDRLSYSINFFNSETYELIQEIKSEYIINESYRTSLQLLNNDSLIFIYSGKFIQISLCELKINFSLNNDEEFGGNKTIIKDNGKFLFIPQEDSWGSSIFQTNL